jgi:Tol biopolymer transport system component
VGDTLLIDTAYATRSGATPVPWDPTYDERYKFNPQWSADGSRILFLGASDQSAGIRIGRILMYEVATDRTVVIDPSGTARNAYWSMGQ